MEFSYSEKSRDITRRVREFVREHILPHEPRLLQSADQGNPRWKEWETDEALEQLKVKARAEGLWNLFLPDFGGLSNTDYAPVAEATGYSLLAPEIFNCNAPDTGNMEVLWKYGTAAQKERWLQPLLRGEIRSAFCMTEPDVASSDATNMQASIREEGDEIVLNGRKWWSTGIGHPNCRLLIFMGLSHPENARHQRHSMVLVPADAPGVEILRMLPVYGAYEHPYGHGEVNFHEVRLPRDHYILGPGKGFEIAQGRLGPGRIHHCMRLIGAAERALELMIRRSMQREAFGKPLLNLGGNRDIIAEARMDIDMARLLVMRTAWLLDEGGAMNALSEVSQIKVVVPRMACRIIDQAIQMHGGAGLSNDFPLAAMYAYARILRLADGPDEVHRGMVSKLELYKYEKPRI